MASVGIRLRSTHNAPRVWWIGDGSESMADRWDEHGDPDDEIVPRERHPRSRHRPRSRRRAKRELSPQERAYRDAQRRANARLAFVSHFVTYVSVLVFLTFVAGFRPAFIVALAWGVGIVSHYFAALVAPDLRRRYIQKEVTREVEASAPNARRSIEDRHVRSLEELSASIAHEIRNPITAAKSLVQQMGEDPASAENVDYAKVALEELDRVERSVAHLLRYAREEDLHMTEVRLADVADSAIETFRERIASLGLTLETEIGTDCILRGDPEKLRRVLINLLGNAIEALQESGTADPRIEVSAGENLARTECWIRVRDNGPGIDPETLSKVFSPFYTSKQSGTGLGLAISKKVVDAHGGSIEATSAPGSGAEFTITIPKQAGRS
jgi:signal transduction histidine kinase